MFLPFGATVSVEGGPKAASRTNVGESDEDLAEFSSPETEASRWFVSNCFPNSRNESYVDELKKHIKVDVFRKCGTLECRNSLQCCKY